MLLLTLFYILSVSGLFYSLWRYKVERSVKFLPGPNTYPVVGSMIDLTGDQEHVWKKLREFNKCYYPRFRFILPNAVIVTLLDPEDIEVLFTSINHIQKSIFYILIQEWLQDGLLTSFGKKWQKRRKILTPGFHFTTLHKYAQIFFESANKMVAELQMETGDRIKNLESWISQHTLAVICETAMGCDSNIFERDEGIEYKNAVNYIGMSTIYRIIRPWTYSKTIFSFSKLGPQYKKSLDILHKFSQKIIRERIRNIDDKNTNELVADIEDKKKSSMLDILIDAYKRGEVDEKGIQEEVDTFVFEGYDTTAMAMIYTVLCLAEYQDVQDRAREEVNQMWNESNGTIGVADIQKLSYLERVIKETLRLYPSVPIIARTISDDLKLKNCVIPKGVFVNVHIYEVHRDPKHWKNPETFNPERFTIENSKGRHPFAYIPFSGGYRNCIGQKFAMMELKILVSFLLRHFQIVPVNTTKDIVYQSDLVLRPKEKLNVKFVPIIK